MRNGVKHDQAVVAKIETLAAKYHTAGMHLRNVGNTLRGKETVTAVKPNGKLAKLAAAPFRAEMQCQQSALKHAEKAIAALDRLDKAPQKTVKTAPEKERPSTLETMKTLKKQIEMERQDSPAAAKTKRREAEI